MARDKDERIKRGEVPRGRFSAYVTIPTSLIASSCAKNLSGEAARMLLLAHSVWAPQNGAALPIAWAAKQLSIGRSTAVRAIRELMDNGLMTLQRAAQKPGQRGVTIGRAAEYGLIGRAVGVALKCLAPGDRGYRGFWRIYASDLRALAAQISGNESKILICMAMIGHRDRNGAPEIPLRVSLSGRLVSAALPGFSPRAADTAIAGLVQKGLIQCKDPAVGSRPGTFEPSGLAAQTVNRRARRGSQPTALQSVAHTSEHGTTRSPRIAHKPPAGIEGMADLRGEFVAGASVARKTGTGKRRLCAILGPAENTQVGNDPVDLCAILGPSPAAKSDLFDEIVADSAAAEAKTKEAEDAAIEADQAILEALRASPTTANGLFREPTALPHNPHSLFDI